MATLKLISDIDLMLFIDQKYKGYLQSGKLFLHELDGGSYFADLIDPSGTFAMQSEIITIDDESQQIAKKIVMLTEGKQYKGISYFDGVSPFKAYNKWGIINENKEIIVEPVYDSMSEFQLGFSTVTRFGIKNKIDTQGNIYADIKNISGQVKLPKMFEWCGNAIYARVYDKGKVHELYQLTVYKDGLWGGIRKKSMNDEHYEIITPINIKCDSMNCVQLIRYYAIIRNGLYGIIDLNEKNILPFEYNNVYEYYDQAFFATTYLEKKSKVGLMFFNGEFVPAQYDRIYAKYTNGKQEQKPFYDFLGNCYLIMEQNGKKGILTKFDNSNTIKIFSPQFDDIQIYTLSYTPLFLIKRNNMWGIKDVCDCSYHKIQIVRLNDEFNGNERTVAVVEINGLFGFIETVDKKATPIIYEEYEIKNYYNDYICDQSYIYVRRNGLWGVLNVELNIVQTCECKSKEALRY